MNVSTFDQELARVFLIDFNANDPFICLYIQHKTLAEEIYQTLHEKFDNGKLVAVIEDGDTLTFSLELDGKIVGTVSGVEHVEGELANFRKKVPFDQRIKLVTGSIPALAANALQYRQPDLIRQQNNFFWLAGYRIV